VDLADEASVIADFAGKRSLEVPGLTTTEEREEWVAMCLQHEAAWPAVCDLRAASPFDDRWWEAAEEERGDTRGTPQLTRYDARAGASPCAVRTLVWALPVLHPLPDPPSGVIEDETTTFVDAQSGHWVGIGSSQTISGRPFAGRVAEGPDSGNPWVRRALEEHASVAAFARHALELMALGAPLELLADVTRAQQDEVRHAQICLARAATDGVELELGPLDTDVPQRTTAFDVAMGVALEGCVNETLSANQLLDEADAATGDDHALLASIAADEVRHAELSWRTLVWLMPRLTGAQRRRVRTAMLRALPARSFEDLAPCVDAVAA
jgi:hypothetical protein